MVLDAVQVSTRLGINVCTVLKMFQSGALRGIKSERAWRTDEDAIAQYILAGIGERSASIDLSAKEVAVYLNKSARTVLRLFALREILAMRVNGKLWRTNREFVERYRSRLQGSKSERGK